MGRVRLFYRPTSGKSDSLLGDGGVDIVAIKEEDGLLIQCMPVMSRTTGVGWESIQDGVVGTTHYEIKHPRVAFTRIAATNHWFNQAATDLAEVNDLKLWDVQVIKEFLMEHRITRFEVESFLATSLPP